MSAPPWETDRALDVELAARLIFSQFSELASMPIRVLGSGWDNDCYRVGNDWVFRFPRRADAMFYVEKEVRAMPLINRALTLKTPVFERFGIASPEFPYPFYGYRFLPGESWREGGHIDLYAFAEQFGKALTQLHSIPIEDAEQAGVPVSRWSLADDLRELNEVRDVARPALTEDIRSFWDPVFEGNLAPIAYDGPLRMTHNDLGPEHVLFDPETGKATGMIDFGDVELGDPARDFAMFAYLFGATFLDRALSCYGLDIDPEFRCRVDFINRARAPIWLSHAVRKGEPSDIAKHVRWLRAYALRRQTW